ncbi:sugar ABC transporter permease [Luedemannella flava]|uniref:Sugar ABC transporter permease n=1 Tax=Luedemannella flava TaxID=349316 RepID=A0ABN2MJJ4_9ACTN
MTAPPGAVAKPRRRPGSATPYLYVAPFFVLFAAFGLFPLIYTAWVSLRDWRLVGGDRGFVGLDNYTEVLTDARFWNALGNTFGLFIVATVPQLLIALWLANLLNRKLRLQTAFRMGVLLPNITSVAAVGIVFGFIFADRYGLVNWLLDLIGADVVEWRASRRTAWFAISVMVDWRWIGYNALIYLAAMQAIPRDLYESAALDGASRARQFWRLTVPMIQPTILFTIIISTIGGMQLFTEPLLFNYGRIEGGPLNEYQTIAMYIYQRTFRGNTEYGYGAAMSWLLFAIIIAFALVNFYLVRRTVRGSSK